MNSPSSLTHLQRLEAESIHILREVVAEAERPVMLYSIGKDSAVMLHLAKKAFYPAPPPFPLLHVDTTWKFQAMYELRDKAAKAAGMELLVHRNPDAVAQGINPFDHGSLHTDLWKTEGLKQALDKYGFDAAFGGARRDEEKSRAKERVFSFRTASHRWDPKNQRPELWHLYNARKSKGESMRVFPISNWTELDVWQYIEREKIALPSIYYTHKREVIERRGLLVPVTALTPPRDGEQIELRDVRFRTVGDITCTCPVESLAADAADVVIETLAAEVSERGATRMDDKTSEASMEKRKKDGYF
jgi:sulfate adenylyltransferase subunit 2